MLRVAVIAVALLSSGCGKAVDPIQKIQELGGIVHIGDDGNPHTAVFASVQITDKDIGLLSNLPTLQHIGLEDVNISDNALKGLSGLKNLKELMIFKVPISGVGLQHIPNLVDFCARDCPIGNDALKSMASWKSLKYVMILNSNITEIGQAEFRELRPDVLLLID